MELKPELIGIIVSNNLSLIGLMFKDEKLDGVNTITSYIPKTLEQLSSMNYEDKYVVVRNNKVRTKGKFELRVLKAFIHWDGVNSPKPVRDNKPEYPQMPGVPLGFLEVPNELELVRRVLLNGELKGYDLVFGDGYIKGRVPYDYAISMRNWLNPKNYVVRETANKKYIAGKNYPLERLPEIELNTATNTAKQHRVATGGTDKNTEALSSNQALKSRSLLELLDIVKRNGGIIIKLKDETYNTIRKTETKVGSDFIPMSIGEVGEPRIVYSETNLNANITFKKVGMITVNMNEAPTPISCFTWTTKSIFVDGESHMKRFGIGVEPNAEKEIVEKFGPGLIIERIKNESDIKTISSLCGRPDYVYFIIDSSKLTLMAKENAGMYILDTDKVASMVKRMHILKAHAKVAKDCIKHCKKEYNYVEPKQLFRLYASMNPETLRILEDAGIDVYTGAYVKREELTSKEKSSEGVSGKDADTFKIEYQIVGGSGQLTKLNFESVVKGIKGEADMPKGADDKMIATVKQIMEAEDIKKGPIANAWLKQVEEKQSAIRKMLWLHKVACFKMGNETGLAIPERENWEEVATKSTKGVAKAYKCTKEGCEGVKIAMLNIDLAPENA